MSRARAIAAVLLGALLCQLALAVPAFAMARILAARCCDVDCPELPSAGAPDRCCAIGTAPAGKPALPSAASPTPAVILVLDATLAPIFSRPPVDSLLVGRSPARAAPLFLVQRSLQL